MKEMKEVKEMREMKEVKEMKEMKAKTKATTTDKAKTIDKAYRPLVKADVSKFDPNGAGVTGGGIFGYLIRLKRAPWF